MVKKILSKLRVAKALYILGLHDSKRYLNNSMVLNVYKNQERLLGLIIARQHVVEKGLTMPETRLGFGRDNIEEMLKLCELYSKMYDVHHEQFQSVIAVLKEYVDYHSSRSYQLDSSFLRQILDLTEKFPEIQSSVQTKITSSDFFKDINESFIKFAKSRHSVRNYSAEDIPVETVEKAIDLAKTAPSACNRQPIRVHVCCGKVKEAVTRLHRGNRGFGDRANKVLVITSNLSSYMNVMERNCSYLDGGIFVMNLLYALHYYHIGACTLNWSTSILDDNELRNILELPEEEEIICLVCIGKLPEELSIAKSERINTERIIKVHE